MAKALLWLIAIITNIAYFHRFSAAPAIPQDDHLGYWSILAPVVGALAIGSMARFGWEKMKLRRMTCPAAYVVEL